MSAGINITGTKSKEGNLPVLALIWVCVAWGSTWIASKIGVKQVPALQLCAMRQLLGGVIWVSYFIFKHAKFPSKKEWNIIFLLSLLNFFFSNALSTWGVQYISSGLGAILGAIFPLWMVIIYFFKGRKLTPLAVVGMLLGFAGVCVIFYDHLKDFLDPNFRLGICLSLTATLTWAFGSMITQEQVRNFNPYFGLGLQMLISGIALSGVSWGTKQFIPIETINSHSWMALAFLVTVGSVATFAAYVYTLKHLPIEIASIYAYVNPMVAVLMGSFIFDEKVTLEILFGGLLTLAGVYLVNYAIRRAN